MTDRDRLLRMLKGVASPKRKRPIVCYDAKWAGLPRITVYDRPKWRKARSVGRVERRRPSPAARPLPVQMELAL